jgi:hypothetical protein
MVTLLSQNDHSLICEKRPVVCKFCSKSSPYDERDRHHLLCYEHPVKCNCGHDSTISQIGDHKALECTLNIVDCPLYSIGLCATSCTGKLMRHGLEAHIKSEMSVRLFIDVVKMLGQQKLSRPPKTDTSSATTFYEALEEEELKQDKKRTRHDVDFDESFVSTTSSVTETVDENGDSSVFEGSIIDGMRQGILINLLRFWLSILF